MTVGRFAGRVALVTGASSGIGAAIAAALAAEGASVQAVARRAGPCDDLRWRLVDLGDPAAVEAAAAQAAAEIDGLDALVHAAGFYATGSVADAPLADLDRLWSVNARAPWTLTRALLPALVARQGSVVFINSSVWPNARGGLGGYAASKYALKAMADALRDEVNAQGVRVLSVFPGRTATPMQEAVFAAEGRPYRPERLLQPVDVARLTLDALAAPRTQEVTDIFVRPALKS